MLKLALRNLFRHRGRTTLTLGAIVFGVVSLILSGGFIEDIFVQLQESTVQSGLGHVQVHRADYRDLGRRDPYAFMVEDPEAIAERLRAVPHVREVMSRLNFTGTLSNGRADVPVFGSGVEPQREASVGGFLQTIEGRRLDPADRFAIELGQGVASALRVGPGDFVVLLASTPGGALNSIEFEVVGVFRSHSIEHDARAVQVPLGAASQLLDTDSAHSLVVALSHERHTDSTIQAIQQLLPEAEFEVAAWYDLADFYQKTVELYRRQFAVLQLVVLLMVALGVANSVNITVFERTGELGTLMAMGNRRREVFRLVVLENTFLGLLGGLLAVPVAIVLAAAVSAVGIPMPPPPNMDVGYTATLRPTLEHFMFAVAIAVVASTVASILPAHRASRMPIVDALRHNQQ